jgi:hypothetical protein
MNAPVGAIDEQSKKCFELYTSRNTFFMSFLRFSGGFSLLATSRKKKLRKDGFASFLSFSFFVRLVLGSFA